MPERLRYPDEERQTMTHALNEKLRLDGRVVDARAGYLYLPWITDTIDVKLQRYAARLIAYTLHQYHPDPFYGVVGLPTMGIPLATTLAEELEIPFLVSRKGTHAPHTWKHPIVLANKLYTNGAPSHHVYNIPPYVEVLLVDDAISNGTTIIPVIDGLRNQGVTITWVAVYVNKLFRPGHQLLEDRGIQTVAAYNIEAIRSDGTFVVAPPGIAKNY